MAFAVAALLCCLHIVSSCSNKQDCGADAYDATGLLQLPRVATGGAGGPATPEVVSDATEGWKAINPSHHAGKAPGPHTKGLNVPVQELLRKYSAARPAPTTPAVLSLSVASGNSSCDQGDVKSLLDWEQWLIKDFPEQGTSTWGHLCFDTTQGAKKGHTQALFILGMKALSNFNYDYCKFSFNKAIEYQPDFVMAYWGRSLCETQLLWNAENPAVSNHFLAKGREQQKQHQVVLSDREEGYYETAEALNNVSRNWTEEGCSAGVEETMPCRFYAFLQGNEKLFANYPDDVNTGAFVVLSRLAYGTVTCTTSAPGACPPSDDARTLAERLFVQPVYDTNPALLHYGLHSFDYPYEEIFKRGLPFAVRYPKLVNGSVHSLHMPSHIYDRNGNFSLVSGAAAADHDSVHGGDGFAVSGALKYMGGPVGRDDVWKPGKISSGFGFAWDMGNIYHSLEYEQYEVLQSCQFRHAATLTERMGVVAYQSLVAGGAHSAQVVNDSAPNVGTAWYDSTTYYEWLYRMQARLAQEGVMLGVLGQVGLAAQFPSRGYGGIQPAASHLPLPLAWKGNTGYTNSVYGPQSEAGLWNAIALQNLLGGDATEVFGRGKDYETEAEAAVKEPSEAGFPWQPACTSDGVKDEMNCVSMVAVMAVERIMQVNKFYLEQGIWYEGNLTAVLALEVQSAVAFALGDTKRGLAIAQEASDLEWKAVDVILPGSTSIYFIPGTAFYGTMALRVAESQAKRSGLAPDPSLLQEADGAFSRCLSPSGRPNLSLCLLGQARVQRALGNSTAATQAYGKLMQNWMEGGRDGEAAKKTCNEAWQETSEYLSSAKV